MANELFESEVRPKGDLAGVFEFDGETGYFYLYDLSKEDQHRIVDSIHVFTGPTQLKAKDIKIGWDDRGERVGLFLRGVQWAVFNTRANSKFGGNCRDSALPSIPDEERFSPFLLEK